MTIKNREKEMEKEMEVIAKNLELVRDLDPELQARAFLGSLYIDGYVLRSIKPSTRSLRREYWDTLK